MIKTTNSQSVIEKLKGRRAITDKDKEKAKENEWKSFALVKEEERDIASFTDDDRQKLLECTTVITTYSKEFMAVGRAIYMIHKLQLWKLAVNNENGLQYKNCVEFIEASLDMSERNSRFLMNTFRYNFLLSGNDPSKILDTDVNSIPAIINTSAIQNIPRSYMKSASIDEEKEKIAKIVELATAKTAKPTGKVFASVITEIKKSESKKVNIKKDNPTKKAKSDLALAKRYINQVCKLGDVEKSAIVKKVDELIALLESLKEKII